MRCFKISYITSIPISRCNTNSNWVRGRLLSILLYLNKKNTGCFWKLNFLCPCLFFSRLVSLSGQPISLPFTSHDPIKALYLQGVQEKLCFFTIHCNPTLVSLKETFKALNLLLRVNSYSYWLVIFCTTNSSWVLARERWQKTQYLMNSL